VCGLICLTSRTKQKGVEKHLLADVYEAPGIFPINHLRLHDPGLLKSSIVRALVDLQGLTVVAP